jgi:hypothetical protein
VEAHGMSLIPIQLPPGVFRNGTPYGAKGRWFDCNLVRWQDNALRPIGGWELRRDNVGDPINAFIIDPDDETPRDMITYRTNDGRNLFVIGSNEKVHAFSVGGIHREVTPTGFTPGLNDIVEIVGYGIGPYGLYTYGTPRNQQDVIPNPVGRWSFDMWGQNVLALFDAEGILYEHTPDGAELLPIVTAPAGLVDFVVTDERIVMGIRNTPEIREVIWSEREDNTIWTPQVDNYAGSQRLQGAGNLVGIYKVQGQLLILSETDATAVTYLGAPLVYGFRLVGDRCGPIYKKAVAVTDRFAIWLGQRNFWLYDGSITQLPCDIIDYVRTDLDTNYVSKMFTMTIGDFSEIWWFYQSVGGLEVDSYITYNYRDNSWAFGRLSRTCGMDRGPFRSVIMVSPQGEVFNHEQDTILVTGAFAQTGPLELIPNGEANTAIRQVFMDTRDFGTVNVEFLSRQFTTDPLYSHGTFAYQHPMPTTGVLGREIHMRVNGLTSRWRFGTPRFDVQEIGGGKR